MNHTTHSISLDRAAAQLVRALAVAAVMTGNAFAQSQTGTSPSSATQVAPGQATPVPLKVVAPSSVGSAQRKAGNEAGVAQRLRRVVFDPKKEITVHVAKGVLTHIVLPDDDSLRLPPGLGQGSDCKSEIDVWCVVGTGRDVFVKPRAGARTTNMDVTTSLRRYSFELKVVQDQSAAVWMLAVDPPPVPKPATPAAPAPTLPLMVNVNPAPPPLSAQDLLANRMKVLPQVVNSNYSVAVGTKSEDIVPSMVFDDGTQTYFSFPHNLPLPTVFETAPDGSEQIVNVHMHEDQLVAERVSRRFLLRLGESVVSVINEKFDTEGRPPVNGTVVPGVARVLKSSNQSAME